MHGLTATAAIAASAMLFALTFPPWRARPLAAIALVPLLVVVRRVRLRTALLLTWGWSLVMAYGVGDWLPRAIASYYEQSHALGVAIFVAVASTMAAPYYVAFAVVYRVLARRFSRSLPLLAAAAWVTAELGRGRLFTGAAFFIGNPWALLGYSQVGVGPLVQIAAVTGVYGISFALAALNAGVAELLLAERDDRRRAGRTLALGTVPILLVLAYGATSLRAARDPGTPGISVAIVQGSIDLGTQWRDDHYGRNLDIYLRLTRDALATDEAPRIVFWPEAAMTFFLEEEAAYQRAIARLLAAGGAELVAGGPASIGTRDAPAYHNSVFMISRSGELVARYDKEYLVPLAEYFPLGRVDLLRRRFGRIRTFTAGSDEPLLPTAAGAAGVAICNEAMLPEVVARRVAAGATYLVNPSNDTWIPEPKFTAQQLDIVTLRAVEQRRYLVRASTSGPSALIDPFGRVLARAEPGTRAAISGALHPRTQRSLYGQIGDAFAFTCAACVVAVIVLRGPTARGVREERD